MASPRIVSLAAALRRWTPAFLLPLVVRVRTMLALRNDAQMRSARAQMQFVLGELRPDADLEAAARGHVERMVWRSELRWHPALVSNQRVKGLERLTGHTDGRGGLLVFMHHAQYDGLAGSMARHGLDIHGIVHPNMMDDDAPTWKKQHLEVLAGGGTMHSAAIGSKGIGALLMEGKLVGISCDVPGRTPMTFLGNRVLGSSGAIHLANATNAPIFTITTHRDEQGPYVQVAEGLEPSSFTDTDTFFAEVLRHHEEAILAWPEAIDSSTAQMSLIDAEGNPVPDARVAAKAAAGVTG